MSKLIIRTFYVKKWEFENMSSFTVCKEPTPTYHDDIQISLQEPEKKIEITESEFDELAKEWDRTPSAREKFNFLKQKLFGASDE